MEKIGALIKQTANLVPKSSAGTITVQNANEPEPLWWDLLEMMAMDKRQDWAPGMLTYWTGKLREYRDSEICEALRLYAGEFFPSVDTIRLDLDRLRERRAEEKQAPESKGTPATPEDWEWMLAEGRRILREAGEANAARDKRKNLARNDELGMAAPGEDTSPEAHPAQGSSEKSDGE